MNELFIRCTDLQTCKTLGMNLAGPYSPNAEDLPDESRNGNFWAVVNVKSWVKELTWLKQSK